MIIWLWIGFILFVLAMLALDLGVLNRGARIISTKKALVWSAFCAVLAVGFSGVVYYLYQQGVLKSAHEGVALSPAKAAIQFLTAWVIEQSLSLDNIFVIALIFGYFQVPREYQHRTLFWGIIGALVMRGIMIYAGVELIKRFSGIVYLFGLLLLYTAWKMMFAGEGHVEPDKNPLVRIARRIYPVSRHFDREHFFTRVEGRVMMTPLFLVLLVVESTDVIFAIDSIPAVIAITHPFNDPFIIFTSNVFAILNLRSLYFALAGLLEKFKHLKVSLVFILAFVGMKMLLHDVMHVEPNISLSVIAVLLAGGVISSMWANQREARHAPQPLQTPAAASPEPAPAAPLNLPEGR